MNLLLSKILPQSHWCNQQFVCCRLFSLELKIIIAKLIFHIYFIFIFTKFSNDYFFIWKLEPTNFEKKFVSVGFNNYSEGFVTPNKKLTPTF